MRYLAGFSGVLQVDGYVGYRQLTKPERDGGPLVLANCWGHFRRQFYDIAKGGNAPIAAEALLRIAALYAIEDEIRGRAADLAPRRSPGANEAARRQRWNAWLKRATRRRLEGLDPRRSDPLRPEPLAGPLPLPRRRPHRDRLQYRRACMRPMALNRKNALFAGSDEGRSQLGLHRFANRDLQAQWREPARLDRRHADETRQPLACLPHRPADALGLRQGKRRLSRQCAGSAALTIDVRNFCLMTAFPDPTGGGSFWTVTANPILGSPASCSTIGHGRGSKFSAPQRPRRGRSTCQPLTGCCSSPCCSWSAHSGHQRARLGVRHRRHRHHGRDRHSRDDRFALRLGLGVGTQIAI